MSSSERHRFAASADRLIILGVILLVGVVACTALDGGSDSRPPDDAEGAPVTIATTPSAATTTSTIRSTATTTTTTIAPTTSSAPTVEIVTDVCDSLRTDGLETRRVMLDALAGAFASVGGDGDGRADVATRCRDALERFEGGVAIRDRVQAMDMAEEDGANALSLTDFTCGAGTFEVTVTNVSDVPLGTHANFAMYVDNVEDAALQSSFAPIVVWSIAPGESEVITGEFADSPQSQVTCNFEGQVFDADPSPAGAAITAEPEYPELTGDDPAVWFPALYEFERSARVDGDVDRVASLVDVRSMSYDETALAISDGAELADTELLEVCERGRSRPDADHIGFVYLERLEDGRNQLSHGLFRRGFDGQWRGLSFARYYESILGNDCLTVDPDAD